MKHLRRRPSRASQGGSRSLQRSTSKCKLFRVFKRLELLCPTVFRCEGCVQVPTPRPAARTPQPPAPPANSRWAPALSRALFGEHQSLEETKRETSPRGTAPDGAARSAGGGPWSQGSAPPRAPRPALSLSHRLPFLRWTTRSPSSSCGGGLR